MWDSLFLCLDDFRIFVGDLGNEVSDDALLRAFSKYPSLLRARVVRDRKTKKTKGFGFVSFKDPQDYLKAMREMNGMLWLLRSALMLIDLISLYGCFPVLPDLIFDLIKEFTSSVCCASWNVFTTECLHVYYENTELQEGL